MTFAPDAYLDSIKDKTPIFSFSELSCKTDIEAHQIKARKKLMELLRIDDIKGKKTVPEITEISPSKDMGTYTLTQYAMTVCEKLTFPFYLLSPKGDKRGLAVALPGHGYGCREAIGLTQDGTALADDAGYSRQFPVKLCELGYIVAVPELLGFGETKLTCDNNTPMNESSCYRLSTNLLMLGLNTIGIRVFQTMRIIDWLTDTYSMDEVVCMGISGGGMVTSFAAAADTRIKKAIVSGYLSSFKDSVMDMFHCICNFVPDMYKNFEMCDLAALIAPRPLLIEAGERDNIFPITAVKRCYSELERIYGILGAPDVLNIDVFDDGHRISGAKLADFLGENT